MTSFATGIFGSTAWGAVASMTAAPSSFISTPSSEFGSPEQCQHSTLYPLFSPSFITFFIRDDLPVPGPPFNKNTLSRGAIASSYKP